MFQQLLKGTLGIIGFIAVSFIVVLSVQAAGPEFGEGGILEKAEPYFEIVNFIIAFVIVVISLSGLKSAGGMVQKAWTMVIIATVFFMFFEALGALKEFHIFTFHGLGDVVEFFAIFSLLLAVRKLQQLF